MQEEMMNHLKAIRGKSAKMVFSTDGAAAVEFALLLPVMLIACMGLIDLGMAVYEKMELTSAARSGAQVATIDSSNATAITAAVQDGSNLSPAVATSVFCQCSDGSSLACTDACDVDLVKSTFVTVTATTTFTPITPRIIPGFPDTIDLSGEVTLRTN
jgi:Flp pilus assembly protein TadG